MSDQLDQFIGDIANAGLALRSMDFSTQVQFAEGCSNVTAGMNRGQAPRYGMAPLVAQSIDSAVSGPTFGMLGSTSSDDTRACHDLYRVYGIIAVNLMDQTIIGTTFESIPVKKTYFFAGVGLNDVSITNPNFFSFVCFGISGASPTFSWTPKAALAYGLMRPYAFTSAIAAEPFNYRGFLTSGSEATSARSLWNIANSSGSSIDYASLAVISVPGVDIPAPWLIGRKLGSLGATTSANAEFTSFGCPNFIIDRKFKNTERRYSLYNVSDANGLERQFSYTKTPTATDLISSADQDISTAQLQGTWVTGATVTNRIDGAAAGTPDAVLWNDPLNYLNTEYSLLLAAVGKPISLLIQSWQRGSNKYLEQAVDLRNRAFKPITRATDNPGGATRYREASIGSTTGLTPVDTCWRYWPNFVRGTALTTDALATRNGQNHVTLGAAGSGVLRASSVYEIAFSIYDKQLGNESNVGKPAKIQTGSDDYVALTLFRDEVSGGNYLQRIARGTTCLNYVPFPTTIANGYALYNYVQFRVYYREEGSFEWLPGLQIDAARYFFDPNLKELYACTGDSVGTTGGQPGGFNDYSELANDAYNCVLVWKQRTFWVSDKSLVFSDTSNPFSYPLRNAVPIQQGQYKGAIVHNYPGQADQDSRLVVFGTNEIYVGKFTGIRDQMAVQVDPDNVGTFDVDGSDFVLNSWTSVTAFSYRSACVADGILFYWGPQGIYRDDGRDTPEKISDELEPTIFTLYAKQRTDDIHCTYSEQTKEIIWFYFDNRVYSTYAATEEQTKLLIYNTFTRKFTFGATSACIDGSQKLNSGSGALDLVRATGGDRTIIFPRVSKASTGVQQAYFFDYRNRAGDMRFGLERLVSEIATPVAGSRRLTLPNGATGISVGDLISTDQINQYTNDQDSSSVAITVENFIGKVTAVNTTGTNFIDVLLPTNIDSSFVSSATLGALNAFPIYVGKTILAANATAGNAFPFNLATQYWCPNGLKYNGFWLYLHMLFKLELLKAEGLDESFGITLSHRTPVSLSFNDQDLIFGEMRRGTWYDDINSDGNQQIYLPLQGVDQMEGQGLKLKFSGLHYAHKWVLQYIASFCSPQVFDFLKRFEGVS